MNAMPQLPVNQRRRTDLLCLVAGLFFFGISMLFIGQVSLFGRPGAPVLIVISIWAAASGAVAIWLFRRSGLRTESDGYHAAILGARAGLMSSLLAAGMIVLAARLSDSGALISIWVSAPLCVLPGALAGMAGASATLRFAPVINQPASEEGSPVKEPGGVSWVAFAISALAIFGFVSPFCIRPWRSYFPAPASLVSPPKTVEQSKPLTPLPPAEPAFRFEPSPQLTKTGALRWELIARHPLPSMSGDGPMVLSRNDRLLAGSAADGTVVLIDLHTLETKCRWRLGVKPQSLAFSPDHLSLIYVTGDTPAHVGVLRVDGASVIPLPQPKNRLVPATPLDWHDSNKVRFLKKDELLLTLNLDTLEIEPTLSPDAWRAMLLEEQRKLWAVAANPTWPESYVWRLSPVSLTTATELPEVEGVESGWPESHALALGVSDKDRRACLVFPSIDLRVGDRFLVARDGSIFLRGRGNDLEVFYFGPSEKVLPSGWRVKMPHAPDRLQATQAKRATDEGVLCAFLYRPVTNPLNEKVIGPDRSRVLALARLAKWEGTTAIFLNTQQSAELAGPLVIADPHWWSGNHPQLTSFDTPHRWWATVEQEETPPDVHLSSLGNQLQVDSSYDAGAMRIEQIREPEPPAPPKPPPALLPPSALLPPPAPAPPSPPAPAAELTNPDPKDGLRIGRFIGQHHRYAREGNLAALVSDYADQVEHLKNGLVDRSFIEKDERKYHAEHINIDERIPEEMKVWQMAPNRFLVRYKLHSTTTLKKDGSRKTNIVPLRVEVEIQNGKPRIVKQQVDPSPL